MIRLDAIPITRLPQISKGNAPESDTGRVNCILHSGHLSAYQELEVQVNGTLLTGGREGDQRVFTWQFSQASDEVRITLLSRGIRTKHWQGCWNERDAILHAGTLPIQVFFNGKPQPLLEAMMAPVLSADHAHMALIPTETVNGSGLPGAIIAVSGEENTLETRQELPGGEPETVIVQDLLIIAASGQHSGIQPEREKKYPEETKEDESDEEAHTVQWNGNERVPEEKNIDEETNQWSEDDEDEESESALWEDERQEVDQEEREDNDDIPFVETDEIVEEESSHDDPANCPKADAQEQTPLSPRTGRSIAAFHAGPLAVEETLQALKNLVAVMPPKTLIIDVRPTSRQKKKYQASEVLSKQLLRAVFGAKFWDRGWAIQTTSQAVPPSENVRGTAWRYIVNTPDSHPDGISWLVRKLEEGYSLVVLDSIAQYRESRRRAIIEELQQRVSDLHVGPLQ